MTYQQTFKSHLDIVKLLVDLGDEYDPDLINRILMQGMNGKQTKHLNLKKTTKLGELNKYSGNTDLDPCPSHSSHEFQSFVNSPHNEESSSSEPSRPIPTSVDHNLVTEEDESLHDHDDLTFEGNQQDEQDNYPTSPHSTLETETDDPLQYKHESTEEFPNGNVNFTREINPNGDLTGSRSVGWALCVYGHHGSKSFNKYCLGIYICPKCNLTERPRIPKNAKKFAPPMLPKNQCRFDKCKLIHVACKATLSITQKDKTLYFVHKGYHNHPKPYTIRADGQSMDKFSQIVNTAPEARPQALLIGSATRPSIVDIHPSFANLGRTTYLRRKLLNKNHKDSLEFLFNFEKWMGISIIKSVSMAHDDSYISLQTEFMARQAAKINECLQTDTVHGFVVDESFEDIHLTFTSGYCNVIRRYMPLLITIMFGKSAIHYERHFEVLFKSLKYESWDSFKNEFPGMTCDFSEAERVGFEHALRNHFSIPPENDIELSRYYSFCEVHFKRSVARISRNASVVPHLKSNEFNQCALNLLKEQDIESFKEIENRLRTEYPNTQNWLNWNLNKGRGKHIFPALKPRSDDNHFKHSKDTNAQESLGGNFQRTAFRDTLSVTETIDHAYRYVWRIQSDFEMSSSGMPIRYGSINKKTNRKAFVNDGRPPDTTNTLLYNKTKNHSGRPRSRNKKPKLGNDISWLSQGIPWGVKYGEFVATNTCPLDTCLMSWFLLCQYEDAMLPSNIEALPNVMVLQEVLRTIKSGDPHRARWLWCTKVMSLSSTGKHSLFSTLDDTFHKYLPELVGINICIKSKCHSDFCPKPSRSSDRKLLKFPIKNPRDFKQKDLENSLIPEQGPCNEEFDIDTVETIDEGYYKKFSAIDSELDESQCFYHCSWFRDHERLQFKALPYLLVLDCLENWYSTDGQAKKPANFIHIDGEEYQLSAILFGSGSHFKSIIYIKGKVVSYDGMCKPPLKWLNPDEFEVPPGFIINQIWYLKKGKQFEIQPEEIDDDFDENFLNNDTNTISEILPQRPPVTNPLEKHKLFKITTGVVSYSGQTPKCGSCSVSIDRGCRRFMLSDAAKSSSYYGSFHFQESCIIHLSPELLVIAKELLVNTVV